MNAALHPPLATIEQRLFQPPAAALARFARQLGRDREAGKVADAALSHLVDEARLDALVDHWNTTLEQETGAGELRAYPWFRLVDATSELCFVHRRASAADALPLLVLHGCWGSLTELAGLVAPLSDPAEGGAAFHVVCPALPGFGITRAERPLSAGDLARACAELMASLGYERYVVHGSDVGASIAAELAALAPSRVLALHVTSLHAFPSEGLEESASLSSAEKSQLALLTLEHDELSDRLPESPIDDLAAALAQLADWDAEPARFAPLLHSLTFAWAFGDADARRQLCASERLRAAPAFDAPVALETYPLDAPCLRRFVTQKFRVVASIEHERGGRLPALEAASELVASLRRAFAAYRQ